MANTLFPDIKKYSILDILRNGKKIDDFSKMKFDNIRMLEQQFNNDNYKDNQFNNNATFNENTFLNSMKRPFSVKNKKVINIDPNLDIGSINNTQRKKNNNNYMEFNMNN